MRSTLTDEEDNGTPRHGAFVPLLLLALAVVGWLAFQSMQLLREREQLTLIESSLQPQEQNAAKLRGSLDAVATATAKLAAAGNANARVIVDELRRRGVTINPNEGGKPP
ncbi:MAG: hypothetical protein ABIS28_18725 [Caldimonas sp.]